MRIGIDCRMYSSSFTGIGRYTHELVENIIRLNKKLKNPHEIILFFNDPEYKNFNSPALAKTPLTHTKKILVNAKHYSLKEQTHFLKKLNAAKLDLAYFPHFNVPILYRKPYILTIHDLTLNLFPGRKMTKIHHRIAYHLTINNATKRAKKIIAVSNNTKKDIQKYLKTPASKIEVIYNGVSKNFRPLKSSKTNSPFLLYTGVWRNHKNLVNLIKAFQIIHTNHPELNLVITGRPDPNYPEVKQTVKDLELQKSVVFPGLVPEKELLHLYNAAEIFVFPSLYEGFGMPPLEAMACGTPVACSNTSSMPEICGQKNALFFDPKDPDDIAKKITQLYKNKKLQQTLIKNGLKHVKNFSWEDMSRKIFKIMQDNLPRNNV